MVQSKNILSLLVLPTLALSSPSLHQRHAHHHHQQRDVNWVYETKIVATTTVTYGHLPSEEPKAEVNEVKANVNDVNAESERPGRKRPVENAPVVTTAAPVTTAPVTTTPVTTTPVTTTPVTTTAVAPKPAPEQPEEAVEQSNEKTTEIISSTVPSSSAPKPSDTAPPSSGNSGGGGGGGQFAIKNNCQYDLTMTIDRTLCGQIESDIPISAGETWYGDITSCNDANPSYKIYKGGDDKPLQLEAGYKPDQQTLWYNISPKDCVSDMYGAGIENCPGGPWLLEAVSTAASPGACQKFQCQDATSCCTSSLGAYCDAWATAAKELGGLEPVGGCLGALSEITLTAQLC